MGLPGAVVIPKHYGEAVVLFSAINRVEAVVDGAPVGPRGRLYIVEPGKPQRVPYEAARFILEHYVYTGVVKVDETETESGISYDLPKAKAESLKLTEEQDHERFMRYVEHVVTDYLNQKKPAPRTPPAIQELINRRGYDLKQYGIFPLGEKESEQLAKMKALEDDNKAKDESLIKLQAQVEQLSKMMATMQAGGQSAEDDSKGKKSR